MAAVGIVRIVCGDLAIDHRPVGLAIEIVARL